MNRYFLILTIVFISCGGRKSDIKTVISSYKVDSIVDESSITYTLFINDTIQFVKSFDKSGNPRYEYFTFQGKMEGNQVVYKDGLVIQKNIMKSGLPVTSHIYYWTGTRLDSTLIYRCKRDLDSAKCRAVYLGTIRYIDGKVDVTNSDYYTIDFNYPVLATLWNNVITVTVQIKSPIIIRLISGILDSNNNRLRVAYDTSYFTFQGRKMFLGHPYNFEGFSYYEGIIELLERIPNDSATTITRKRYPFYFPFYVTNKKIEWYFGNRYYSVN